MQNESLFDRARGLNSRWFDATKLAHGYLEGTPMRRVYEENAVIVDAQLELACRYIRRLP